VNGVNYGQPITALNIMGKTAKPFWKKVITFFPIPLLSFPKTFDLIIVCIASCNKSKQVFKGDWEFEGKRKIFPQEISMTESELV
jgi:hypothetical protein